MSSARSVKAERTDNTTSSHHDSFKGITRRIVDLLIRNRIRITAAAIFAIAIKDVYVGTKTHSVLSPSDPWTLSGLLLIVGGVLYRTWAAGVLDKNKSLATCGPYSLSRNPLYLGSLLLMVGFCLITGAVENLVILTSLGLVLYLPKILREEKYLMQKFGQDWSHYVATTPRLIPRRLYASSTIARWSRIRWAFNGEYKAIAGSAFGLFFLAVWHYVYR